MKENTSSNSNFIKKIIERDLKQKKYSYLQTRFPPEPNGYLHIGHAKSICLNFGLAKYYKGKCNLRFDDTNPTKENIEYINAIKKDIRWLGFQWNGEIQYSSKYFNIFKKYAIELIAKGLAYVDQLNKEEIRQYRGTLKKPGTNSPYRNRSVTENMLLFEKMENGHLPTGTACLRAKIDMSSPFMIMRDPVLYRIIFSNHHQTKDQWCIYPTYDFSHCISDSLEGITHSICTLEFQDNRRLYDWILDNITIQHRPNQYEYSRLNLEYTILSKRKLNILVNKKIVNGWDDPRMPTITGLRRRGYTPSSIRTFCQKIGITKQDNLIETSSLESCIRNELNKTAPRNMAILNPIKILLSNVPNNYQEIFTVPNHPTNNSMGFRSLPFTNELYIDYFDFHETNKKDYRGLILGQEIRLRYGYVIKAIKVKKDIKNNIINVICTCDFNTLGKNPKDRKIKGVIHWLSTKHASSATFHLYNTLFTVKNPEKEKNFLNYINPKSFLIKKGFVESNITKIKNNQVYQFEREGYFCIEKNKSNSNLIFNRIITLRNKKMQD
ncbi:glutamine--tRNA ligase [Buchnera aphidicola (Pemphigus obesinymphae)]|uniref:glutamine--tRNA ligase n=1 Tax=Buchnera aphidicola TaxID=9 RepID=UPI002238CC4C|nr:glutamine--tRNA ligase [Buchnera aphidicola]MCW5196710.1 glutamine--tRNA ligase [Buchnera aphidicola (Pemphigus obesinymphae)]